MSDTLLLTDCCQAVGICMLEKAWQEMFLEFSVSVMLSVQPLFVGFLGIGGGVGREG